MSYTMQWVWADPSEQLLPCPERSCSTGSAGRSGAKRGSPAAPLPRGAPRHSLKPPLTACASLLWVVSYFTHIASLAEGQCRIWEPKSIAPSSFPGGPCKKLFYLRSSESCGKTRYALLPCTPGSACFWVSAVLALHCWASYPCWGLRCNSHSFYILCKK